MLQNIKLKIERNQTEDCCYMNMPMCSFSTEQNLNLQMPLRLVAYSHCTGTGPEQIWGMGPGAMGPNNILYRNVHTSVCNRERNQDSLFSIELVQFLSRSQFRSREV